MIFNQSILNIEIDDGGLDDTIVRSRIQTYPWGEESPRAYPTFGFESSNPLGGARPAQQVGEQRRILTVVGVLELVTLENLGVIARFDGPSSTSLLDPHRQQVVQTNQRDRLLHMSLQWKKSNHQSNAAIATNGLIFHALHPISYGVVITRAVPTWRA